MLVVIIAGCLSTPKLEKETQCPQDYMLYEGRCCVDLDANGVCDTAEVVGKAKDIVKSMDECMMPEIEDPRHPGFCCADLDGDKKCDYLRELM